MIGIVRRLKRLRALILYKRAVRMADEEYNRTRIRQFVIKNDGNKLLVIDKYSLNGMKKRGVMDKKVKVIDIQRNCFYATPDAAGRDKLTDTEVEARKQMCLNVLSR